MENEEEITINGEVKIVVETRTKRKMRGKKCKKRKEKKLKQSFYEVWKYRFFTAHVFCKLLIFPCIDKFTLLDLFVVYNHISFKHYINSASRIMF